MYIIMLGTPGAGKGTQADILSRELDLPHIASGDLFRQALENESETGLAAKSYMESGSLVPDEITIRMILERMNRSDCARGCILDGFPRTLQQAKVLDRALEERGEHIEKAICIEVPEEELVKRLSGRLLCRACQAPYHAINSPPKTPGKCDRCNGELYQRPDDRPDTVRERLAVFLAETAPLLDHYDRQGKLVRVDGNLGIQGVAGQIVSALRAQELTGSESTHRGG
ncbi:MAG: adenylate kinase [Dehalococcoidia bacterium]